jgi:sulfate/thiosulfate transport system permease protein
MGVTGLDVPQTPPRPAVPDAGGARIRRRRRPAWGRLGLRGVAVLYLGLMVVLPLSAVVTRGFGGGMASLRDAFSQLGARQALILTIELAAIVAVINAFFGTITAFVLTRYRFGGRRALATVVDIPFAIPTLVTGVMLVALYGPISPVGGFLARHGVHIIFAKLGIMVALLFVTLPLVVRTVQPVMQELDRGEEEAAQILGAGRWLTFRRVMLPHLRTGIVAGSLLAFARALGEFGAVVIVSGNIANKTLTAPVLIAQLITGFKDPRAAAAIGTILFGLAFVLVLVVERLVGHKELREHRS